MTSRQHSGFDLRFIAGKTTMGPHSRGGIWRENGMEGWILHLTTSGAGILNRHEAKEHHRSILPGTLLLFPAGVVHDYDRHPDQDHWHHWWVYFLPSGAWFRWFTWPRIEHGIGMLELITSETQHTFDTVFAELIAIHHGHQPGGDPLVANLIEQLLIRCALIADKQTTSVRDERISFILDWIDQHLDEQLSVDRLASMCQLSASRFAHAFRDQVGTAPQVYVQQQRLHKARGLVIGSDEPIQRIAESVGIPDSTWFARCFRRAYGCSPRTLRKRELQS